MLFGGEMLGGLCYIWWNFVVSSKERIEEVKEVWCECEYGDFCFMLFFGDEDEFILFF